MIDLEQIIQPIAGANPCGIDLEYDSRFQAIKDLVDAGTEDSPTNWKKVQKDCVELLNDGRNVELLVLLAVSLVATDGFVGLRDGLHILAQSVQEFWDTIYPELDMDEPESERHEIRLNTLAQLGEQPRKMGDKLCFVERILRAPLSPSNARGAPGFWPVWEHESAGGEDASEADTVQNYGGNLSPEDRAALLECIDQSIGYLRGVGSFLMEQTGMAYSAPFDEHLLPILQQIHNFLDSGEAATVPNNEASAAPADASANSAAAVAVAPSASAGTINSSDDVRKVLDKIIAYYRKAEPSSPVPYLLVRAQKLIAADFMEIVKNLNQDSEHQFRTTLNITESD